MSTGAHDDLGENDDMPQCQSVQHIENSQDLFDIDPNCGLELKTDPDRMDTKEAPVDLKVNSNDTRSIPQQKQMVELNKIDSRPSDFVELDKIEAKPSDIKIIQELKTDIKV